MVLPSGYRSTEPDRELVLPPAETRSAHFLPLLFGVIGLVLAGLVASALARFPRDRVLTCTRTGEIMSCVERSSNGERTVTGPANSVRELRTRNSNELVLDNSVIKDVEPKVVARVAALKDGGVESVELGVSTGFIMGTAVGGLLALGLFSLAIGGARQLLARRRPIRVSINRQSLSIEGGPSLPREPGDPLRVIVTSRGRGQIPMMALVYGTSEQVLFTRSAFRPAEFDPAVSVLSAALSSLPAAATSSAAHGTG